MIRERPFTQLENSYRQEMTETYKDIPALGNLHEILRATTLPLPGFAGEEYVEEGNVSFIDVAPRPSRGQL